MKRNFYSLYSSMGLMLLVLFSGACATVNNLQTAETLEKGAIQQTVAVGFGGIDIGDDDSDADASVAASTLAVDYAIRYGLTDSDELGLRLANFATYIQGDYKRALIKGEKFFLSTGIALGGTQVTFGSGDAEFKQTFIDISVPVFLDYKFGEMSTLFFSPKYMLSIVSSSDRDDSDNESRSFSRAGASAGIKYGRVSGVLAEFGFLKSFKDEQQDLWQASAGFFF